MAQPARRVKRGIEDLGALLKNIEKDIAASVKPKMRPEELGIKPPKEYFKIRRR